MNKSKYDYACEFYEKKHYWPSEKELANYILFNS